MFSKYDGELFYRSEVDGFFAFLFPKSIHSHDLGLNVAPWNF
jgi:hypothetical protein